MLSMFRVNYAFRRRHPLTDPLFQSCRKVAPWHISIKHLKIRDPQRKPRCGTYTRSEIWSLGKDLINFFGAGGIDAVCTFLNASNLDA